MSPIIVREATFADARGIARVHVDSWRTSYRGIVPDDYLAQLSYDQRAQQWNRTLDDPNRATCVYVADDGGEIVGFASGGANRSRDLPFDAELYAIYLRESYQRRGLGARLTRVVGEWLHAQGHRSLLVWVLADNPARRFYESLGGQLIHEQPFELGGTTLIEAGYGWNELDALLRTIRAIDDQDRSRARRKQQREEQNYS